MGSHHTPTSAAASSTPKPAQGCRKKQLRNRQANFWRAVARFVQGFAPLTLSKVLRRRATPKGELCQSHEVKDTSFVKDTVRGLTKTRGFFENYFDRFPGKGPRAHIYIYAINSWTILTQGPRPGEQKVEGGRGDASFQVSRINLDLGVTTPKRRGGEGRTF